MNGGDSGDASDFFPSQGEIEDVDILPHAFLIGGFRDDDASLKNRGRLAASPLPFSPGLFVVESIDEILDE